MLRIIKLYFSDFHIKWILISSVILNFALFLFFIIFIRQGNIPIVLHYNIDWGVDYFGEVKSIFILPSIGLIILVLNIILSFRLWLKTRNRSVSYVLTAIILLVQVFLWLSGIALYIINS